MRLFISDQEQIEKIMNTNPLCLVAMPISCGDRKYGIFVYISTPHDMPCGDLELSMAQDLSKRASLAIDNARLFARANDANRAKSAFLANMSHEIRTPLGVIMGFADLMTDDHVTPAQIKEGATRIKNNGSMLLKVVDEILDLSKIESEQLHLENQKFSLKQVVDDIYHLFEYRAQAKGLKFWIGPIPELDFQLYSDPLRIKQILINIVGNAIKFTETGFVRVNVELDHLSREGSDGELRFTVADSGIGVASDKVDKIFQPFVQGDSSMTRLFGGTGLGLFLARRLARLMGGDVRLKTDASIKGCEFEVRLRVQRGDALPAQASDASAGGEKTAACPGPARPLRALIVDDADDNRLLLSSYLKRLNWDYDVAVDGFEALQKVDEGQFEVVLMDIQMPLMDGFEALKKLRLRNFNRPVIAVTAHAMKGDREQCILAGFDDYLSKPVSRSALQQVLERQEMKDQFSEVSVSL